MARKPITPPRIPGDASDLRQKFGYVGAGNVGAGWDAPPRIPGDAPVQRQAFVARRGDSPMEPGYVVHIPVDARRLITIGPDHDVWRGGHIREDVDGAIVRLFPPADCTPASIQVVEGAVRGVALAVKVMPAAPDDRVLVETDDDEPHADTQSIREVVYEMVTVARTGNRDLLVDVVEEALCAAGL